jgi:protein-ribulosamine 3-kinase
MIMKSVTLPQTDRVVMLLTEYLKIPVLIDSVQPVTGGCISECYKVNTTKGIFFLKLNRSADHAMLFETEVKGLQLLNNAVKGITPAVIGWESLNDYSQLILEWVEPGKPVAASWLRLAKELAMLHKHSNQSFGLDHANFIGSLPQNNSTQHSWIDFFILNRLEPQLKRAIDDKKLPAEMNRNFAKLFPRLDTFFPAERPALLHGDLWSGNILHGNDAVFRFIDPAMYYGHREMDLAMTKLFGGFDQIFYEAYHDYFPLEPGIEDRFPVQQLYPLLVHVNLFGGSYAAAVSKIINKIT